MYFFYSSSLTVSPFGCGVGVSVLVRLRVGARVGIEWREPYFDHGIVDGTMPVGRCLADSVETLAKPHYSVVFRSWTSYCKNFEVFLHRQSRHYAGVFKSIHRRSDWSAVQSRPSKPGNRAVLRTVLPRTVTAEGPFFSGRSLRSMTARLGSPHLAGRLVERHGRCGLIPSHTHARRLFPDVSSLEEVYH